LLSTFHDIAETESYSTVSPWYFSEPINRQSNCDRATLRALSRRNLPQCPCQLVLSACDGVPTIWRELEPLCTDVHEFMSIPAARSMIGLPGDHVLRDSHDRDA
jgi:hypothetical protein